MKIAISNVQEFNPTIGGIERVSVSLANELVKYDDVEIIFVACRKSPYSKHYELPAKQYFLPTPDDFSHENVEAFANIVKSERVDIILNQNAHSFLYNKEIEEVALMTEVKVVSVLHFCPDMRLKANRNIVDWKFYSFRKNLENLARTFCTNWPMRYVTMYSQKRLYRHLYEMSDKCVLLSEKYFDSYSEIAGLKERSKLCAINNMLSFPYEDIHVEKKKQILFCGRFNQQKNPYRALYAWKELQDRLPDWTLQMVGDGPLLSQCKELARKLNLERVKFPGFKNPQQYYKDSPVLWMTSNYEGWGLVLTEAMQYKCVPLAFESFEAVSDIIQTPDVGCLINPFDIKALADSTFILIDNNKLVEMSSAAYIKAGVFDASVIGMCWKRIFEELTER